MTGVRKTTDWATKLMRYIARALTVIWAGWWMFFLVGSFLFDPLSGAMTTGKWDLLDVLAPALVVLFFGSGAAVPWRWEGAGGVVLVLESLLALVWAFVGYADYPDAISFLLPTMVLPPLVAGSLFLASWRRSGRGEPQGLGGRREYIGFLVANVGAAVAYPVQRLREWWGRRYGKG